MIAGAWTTAMSAGLDVPCPRCMALAHHPCVSGGGRVLKVTHEPRARIGLARVAADRAAVRRYVSDAMAGRVA